jgi:hypothetical protein
VYETLIMLKPGSTFSVDDLERIALDIAASDGAAVERKHSRVRITAGSAILDIAWDAAPHVAEESNEIAERYAIPCEGCRGRFEMEGDDPEMELFNSYLMINERLQAIGCFVIFDSQECKLLFEDE